MTNLSQCQWIGPEQTGPTYLMSCSCPSLEGRNYCSDHLYKVYQEGTALRKGRKDLRIANSVWDLEQLFREVVEELESEGLI